MDFWSVNAQHSDGHGHVRGISLGCPQLFFRAQCIELEPLQIPEDLDV